MKKNIKYFAIALILLCCLMGAASAADDVSADVVDASADAVAVDAVSEDVSDSVESTVVEQDDVVDDSASDSLKSPQDPTILKDPVEIYLDKDTYDIGTGLDNAFNQIGPGTDGIIYIDEGTFEIYQYAEYNCQGNVKIIGKGVDKTTILIDHQVFSNLDSRHINSWFEDATMTFSNLTFASKANFTLLSFDWGVNFENVKFSNVDLDLGYFLYQNTYENVGYLPFDEPMTFNFYNCSFVNHNADIADPVEDHIFFPSSEQCHVKGLIKIYSFNQANFYGCTFSNITDDSLVHLTASSQFLEEQITIKNSSFINCNLNGYFDIMPTVEDILNVENCWFESNDPNTEMVTATEGIITHHYYNYTNGYIVAKLVNSTAIDYENPTTFTVSLVSVKDGVETDYDGSTFANIPLTYTINGETKEGEIVNGIFTFDADLTSQSDVVKVNVGSQELTVELPEPQVEPETNDTNGTNNTNDTPVAPTKVATKLTAAKVTATYNVAKKLVITLTADGKALANKKVTVKVGTISKTLTTNAKGQVSLNVATLVPKTYTATVKFAGDSDYTASAVSPKVVVSKAKVKLAAKAKTFKVKVKTKKFTATLKNNKGKVLKNTKLTLKVGKKTYTAKTNKKGVATFKITKLTKKGKYTATVKFAGNKYYKALSKKVKITVK